MPGGRYDFHDRRAGFDDMVFMPKNTVPEIGHNLKIRFDVNYIYTYIGPVLIAVNPYRDVDYCGEHAMDRYRGTTPMDNAPHVFAIAEDMFSNMLIDVEKQCVIISGESGAGKTVSAKLIMSYIAQVSGGGTNVQRIKEMILQSNPLLEAFGNAKTIRNDNSSRFGKYVEMQFSRGGEPIGGVVSNFLLEKSRVVTQADNERNFHIFYQLLSNRDVCQQYALSQTLNFQYINQGQAIRTSKIDDAKAMHETEHAMDIVGLSKEVQMLIFRSLAGILHLGNVQFGDRKNYADVLYEQDLRAPCTYLGISPEDLRTKLISRRLEFKEHDENKQIEQAFTVDKAIFTRDALAKSIYARIFDFLIQTINSAVRTPTRCELSLGILDIYGFEVLTRNKFEQFCINYVNEKLQQIFIELTLKKEQEEYRREQIWWEPISFSNNLAVCDLFEARLPPGLFLLLDDICTSSHATTDKVDKSFLHKLESLTSPYLLVSPPTFAIQHYASSVVYHADQFCEKNRDVLNNDLIDLMKSSSVAFLASLFSERTSDMKSRPTTVGTKIRAQTNLLVETLMACRSHYVRCIKPNEHQTPAEWNSSSVMEQIKYLGLAANIDVRKAGFVYRREFDKFLDRYAILTEQTWPQWHGPVIEGILHIVETMNLSRNEVRLGSTKVFIKSPESLHLLEVMRSRKFDSYARVIQKAMKRNYAARVHQQQREQATAIFRGRKERNARSLHRDYLGDYCNLHQRAHLQRLIPRHERVYFSSYVYKYDRRFRRQGRYLLCTNQAVYVINEEHISWTGRTDVASAPSEKTQDDFSLDYKIKRRIPLENIDEIKLSEYQDHFFLICVTNDYVTLLELSTKTEAILVIAKSYEKKVNRPLPVTIAQSFDYPVKKQGWIGGGLRTMKFVHSATAVLMKQVDPSKLRKTHDESRAYDTKVDHHAMMVIVPTGLSKDSKPQQRASLELRLKSPASTTPRKPARANEVRRRTLRALYDFQARSADELSFRADDELELLSSRDNNWLQVSSNGKTGTIPANYVEIQL